MSNRRLLRSRRRPRALALAFAASCLAFALLASGSSAQPAGYSTPVELAGTGGNPEIAVDAQGRATVTWVGGPRRPAMAVRLDAAGDPGPIRRLHRADENAISTPKIAVDPTGRTTVAWIRSVGVVGLDDRVRAVRLDAAGNPGPVETLSAGGHPSGTAVAAAPDGRATVVWGDRGCGPDRVVQAAPLDPAGSPGPAQTLYEYRGTCELGSAQPQIAVDPEGRATVTWVARGGLTPTYGYRFSVHAVRLDAAGNPGPVHTLSEQGGSSAVAVDPEGQATIAWTDAIGPGRIQAARVDAAGQLGPIQTLSNAGRHPEVAVDPEGRATVVWRRFDGADARVQAVRLDPGGDPGPVRTLSRAGRNAFRPQVEVDTQGRATVVWRLQRSRGSARVQAVRLDAAGNRGKVHTVGRTPRLGQPRVAVDPEGRATIVWDGANGGVRAAHSVRLFEVEAKPKRRTVGARRKRVRYHVRAINRDTEPSGVVRLCAKAPARRARVLGKRCRVFEDVEPGAAVGRVIRLRPRARARGKLTRIRLRARGPNVEAETRALLNVNR